MKILIETDETIKFRLKETSKKNGCAAKQLTNYIMDRGLAPFESGEVKAEDIEEIKIFKKYKKDDE